MEVKKLVQNKIVSFPAPFQAYGAGDEGLDNDHSSTTERVGQRSLERRLIFKEPEFETKFEHKVDTFYIQIFVL